MTASAGIGNLVTVEGVLNFLSPTVGRPRSYAYDPPANEPQTTVVTVAHRVRVHDARTAAGEFTLDRQGFALVEYPSAVKDFYDDDEVKRVYYPESKRLLKEATGATRIFIFDHTTRRRVPGADDRRNGVRQPVSRVHVDHTAKSGPQRVRDLIPDEAEDLLQGRVQIINVWRPIKGPLYDAPLVVCDARSVAPQDLVPSDLVYPHRIGETYSVKYRPSHLWYYFSAMAASEALLLKCYDSKTDGRARFAPHTAFADPQAPPDARPRESIEIRALVFHPAS